MAKGNEGHSNSGATRLAQGQAVSTGESVAAGDFATWLRTWEASEGKRDRSSDVPCGDCTGCCRSSMFIHIRPDETRALARIPPELLFPAPGLARGHVLMGYNERGECPMLQNNRCSIYEDRPQTCRDYDCRVFAAAALEPDGRTQPVIAERVRAWRFEIKSDEVQADQEAIAATAAFLREMPAQFPNESLPTQPSQLALLAIRLFRLFRKLPRERAAGGLLREIQRRRRRD